MVEAPGLSVQARLIEIITGHWTKLKKPITDASRSVGPAEMIKNMYFRRIATSVSAPIVQLYIYLNAFDGAYTRTDMLWGAAVTIAFAVAIYLYFPIGKRVERGSMIWFLGLFAAIAVLRYGLVLNGYWTDLPDEFFPVERRAWGEYLMYFSIWIPVVYMSARNRPTRITLFKGPARWNETET